MAPTASLAALGVQCGWMDPKLRNWLIATRPWSLPVSLVPMALAGTVLLKERKVESLITADFAICLFAGMLVHLAANLANTYFDFKKGADTLEHADDRTLVEKRLTPKDVRNLAISLLAAAILAALYFTAKVGLAIPGICGMGAFLALFYTADPVGLKYIGLGDLTVFLCFGPLLMEGVALCLTHSLQVQVFWYSVPVGLLTASVLHANNARDMEADRRVGGKTLALLLGKTKSFQLYQAYVGLSFVFVVGCAAAYGHGLRVAFVGVAVPWALYLVRLFRADRLAELPQRTAQFEAFFGTALIASLSEPMFVARFLLGCLFYLGAINNILMWKHAVAMVSEDVRNLAGIDVPQRLAELLLACAVALQGVASLTFILGYFVRESAFVLILFLIPVTLMVHDFWTIPDAPIPLEIAPKTDRSRQDQDDTNGGKGPGGAKDGLDSVVRRKIPTFLTLFDNEFVHFFKNIGMLGGLVLFLECGC